MRSVPRAISGAHRLPGAAIGAALIGSVWIGDCPIGEPRVCMQQAVYLSICHGQIMKVRHVTLNSALLAGKGISGRLEVHQHMRSRRCRGRRAGWWPAGRYSGCGPGLWRLQGHAHFALDILYDQRRLSLAGKHLWHAITSTHSQCTLQGDCQELAGKSFERS